MQKFIRIMAIVAAVLVGLSFLLLLISIPFQRFIARNWMNWPDEMIGALPIFPLSQVVNSFLLLGCTIFLIVCSANKKGGIFPEILVFASIALLLPALNSLISNAQLGMLTVQGAAKMSANSIVNQISAYCLLPGNLGRCIALTVCGMGIVFKRMSKKLEKIVAE